MIELKLDQDDDERFSAAATAVINGTAHTYHAADVIVVKVDNWFGSKWLGFSHKMLGVLSVHRRKDFPIPPFRPSRIVLQQRFARDDDLSPLVEIDFDVPLHVQQESPENSSHLVSRLFPETTLFWWSGRSRSNARGSLMCYFPAEGGHAGWYAGFRHDGRWAESDSVGVTAPELTRLAEAATERS